MGPNFVLDKGYLATTVIGRFRAVIMTANDQIKQVDGAAARALGICQEDIVAGDVTSATGRIADIRILGISRCVNGTAGALARNIPVATDNVGRVVAATDGQPVVGVTLTAGAAQGDHVDVLLTPGVVHYIP